MSAFVSNCRHDRYFAVSEIVWIGGAIKRENGFGYYHVAHLRDGDDVYLDDYVVDGLTDPIVAVVPALPGYSTIQTGNCVSGEPYTIREPVLCWQMLASGEMRPVTIRGPNNGELRAAPSIAVEQPSGEIWMPNDDAIYPTFDEYRTAELERQEQEEADRAARNAQRKTEQGDEQ